MALRLQCTYYSFESNTPYTISVYDEEYAGAVVDFNTDEEGHIISYTGEGEGMKVPILTTKCDVNILIETQAIEDFLTDFNTAYEGQFRLKITSGSTGIWYGHILTDLVTIEDLPIDQKPIFTLSATDGIKRLQKVPYKDTSEPYSGQESIIQHLLNCIAFIGLTDLMTDNTHVLKSVVNWVPASITSGDEMDNTYFEHRALYQIDDKGNYKYNSVYRVLENLCYAFHAQFRMGAGGYWFFQHNEYENNSVTPYAYASNKTLVSSSAMLSYITVDDKFTGKFGRGYRSFFPPLNYAQVNYVHFGYVNLARGYIWLETNQPTIPESPTVYRVGDNTSFHFKANFNYTISATGAKPKYTKFNITLQVDTNYLRRDSSGGNGSIYNQPQSIESSSDTYELTVETPVIQYDPMITPIGQGNFITEFTSIPFPTGGVVSFTIDFVDCYDTFGVVINSGLDVRWKFSNVELTPIPANDVSTYSNTRSVTAYNATTGNSESEIVNTIIGQEFGFGRLRIDNGSDFEDGVDWGVGATVSDRTFEELLAIELMRSQSVPIQKMTMSFQHDSYDGLRTIKHKSNTWVFYKGRWHGAKEYWEGEWRLLNTSGTTTGNTSLDWVIDNIDSDGNPIITVVPTGSGGTPNLGNDDSGNPNNPGYNSSIESLFPRTTDDIDSGNTVTEIPIEIRGKDGEYKFGQAVTLIDPYTGAQQTFVIQQDSMTDDTVLYVAAATADFTFPEGSWITVKQDEQSAINEYPRKIEIFSQLSYSGEIIPVTAFAFLRVSANSCYYDYRAKGVELQIYSVHPNETDYAFSIKKDGISIFSDTITGSNTIYTSSLSFAFLAGLYSFHLENNASEMPFGVNVVIEYTKPLYRPSYISTAQSINSPYPENAEALVGGVEIDELYELSLGNYYGMPEGLVVQCYSTLGYPSDLLCPMIDNNWYAVSQSNEYGVPWGAVRSKNYSGTKYENDTDAGIGGVSIGETYVMKNYLDGFIKIRKS